MNTAKEEKPTAKPRAEIIVQDVWKDVKQDVDIWIRRVDNEICGYSSREVGPFILHGDHTSASYGVVNGKPLKEASETISIIRKVPGTYQISLHGFRVESDGDGIPVEIQILGVDPFKRFVKIDVMVKNAEELPVCEFKINADGQVVDVLTDIDILSKFLN
jgi:hypothetical protein